MATLNVVFKSSVVRYVTFSNNQTASYPSDSVTFTSAVNFSAANVQAGWSGTLYWDSTSSGSDLTEFATVSNGIVTSIGSAYTVACRDRTIYIFAVGGSTPSSYTLYAGGTWPAVVDSIWFTDGTSLDSSSRSVSFSGQKKFSQVSLTSYAIENRWSGDIYWSSTNGASTYRIATATNGMITMNNSAEPVDFYNGDRTIYFLASGQYNLRYYYMVRFYGNGGTFSNGSTYNETGSIESSYSAPTFYTSGYLTPTRANYDFAGWAASESGTVKDSFTMSATSTTSSSPTVNYLWAQWKIKEYTTRRVNFTPGYGVSSFQIQYYDLNHIQRTMTVSSAAAFNVQVGTTIYIVSNSISYTNSTFSNGCFERWTSGYGSLDSRLGTQTYTLNTTDTSALYLKVSATQTITMSPNGGKWTDTQSTSARTTAKGQGSTLSFSDFSNILSRDGYVLLGWSASSSATAQTWNPSGQISMSDSNTTVNFYAVWGKRLYIKCGKGIQQVSIQAGNLNSSTRNATSYDGFNVPLSTTITISMLRFSGYERPIKIQFQPAEGGAVYAIKALTDSDSTTFTYTDGTRYVTPIASQEIPIFTWCGNDSTDNAKIAKGQSVSNLTASSWNEYKRILKLIIERLECSDISVTGDVSKASIITASEYNSLQNALLLIKSQKGYSGLVLPSKVNAGDEVKASLFNGSGSLKDVINKLRDKVYS